MLTASGFSTMNIDPRLLRLARSARLALSLTIGLGFLGGVLVVLQAQFLSQVVSRVFLEGQPLGEVAELLRVLFAIILLRACLAWGLDVTANAVAIRVKSGLRQQLFKHILDLGPEYVREGEGGESRDGQGIRTGELTHVAVEGIESLDAYFSQYLPQLALAALVPAIFLAFIFPVDMLSGVILLITAPLIPLFMMLIGSLAEALTKRQWQILSRLSAYFLDVLQGLTTLKILGRSRAQIKVIAQISERYRQTTMGVLRVTFLSALALELVSTLSTAVVAVEIGLRLLYGGLSFERAFFVLLLAPEFYLPLRMLGARFHAGMAGVSAAQRLFEILELQPAVPNPAANSTHRNSDLEIRFEEVHYAYEASRPALNGVSFRIAPGQMVALVGPSGAGKSTVISLLLQFTRPGKGRICVGEVPLETVSPMNWRRKVAWVPQSPYLFHDTVAANIRLAKPEATLEEVISAARLAHADEFIDALPQGYETLIGERGMRLSGGQAQRIALARAFLKNAPILILDEATSNLDPENETYIREAMLRLTTGRTTLMIAHRLSSVYQADQIVVLDKGRVVETGTHFGLLKNGGLYRRLVKAYSSPVPSPQETATGLQPLDVGLKLSDAGQEPLPGPDPRPAIRDSRLANRPRPSTSNPYTHLLKLVAPFSAWVALAALMGFATIGSAIGLMTTSAYIIAAAALHPSIAALDVAIVGVRFFGITRGLFRYLERYLSHQVTFRLLARLRVWFYQALEPLAPARLLGYRAGDLLNRAIGDIASLENFYVRALAPPLVALLVSAVMIGFFYTYHPSLAANLLVFLLAAGVGVPLLVSRLSRGIGLRGLRARSALNVVLVDGIQGMADLLAFGREEDQLERAAAASRDLASAQKKMAQIEGLQSGLMILLANLCMWATLVLAIPLVRTGKIEGVYLALLVLAALTCFEAVLPLPLAFQYLEGNLEATRRLLELVDARPEVQCPAHPAPVPQSIDLRVKDLGFRYLPGEPLALEKVSFSLPRGKRLAIVGPSGAGKSTLVNLLLRFWQIQEGEILWSGQDLRRFSPDDVRAHIGVVSQNTHLFNASVRENLLLARPEASQSQIVEAARNAQIHDFIQSLPQGYETWIGEGGLRLSGGERQRLAIARALLKDAPLIILDEATANLDPITERQVLDSITRLMQNRTTLIITHRLAGMELMDEILVLQAGQVCERGTHAQLLKRGGLYRHMWDLQNQVLEEMV